MVMSCITLVQYYNQEMDIDRVRWTDWDFTNFACIHCMCVLIVFYSYKYGFLWPSFLSRYRTISSKVSLQLLFYSHSHVLPLHVSQPPQLLANTAISSFFILSFQECWDSVILQPINSLRLSFLSYILFISYIMFLRDISVVVCYQ